MFTLFLCKNERGKDMRFYYSPSSTTSTTTTTSSLRQEKIFFGQAFVTRILTPRS